MCSSKVKGYQKRQHLQTRGFSCEKTNLSIFLLPRGQTLLPDMTANVKVDGIKDREQLYKLVIGQLYYDGYESVAASLAKVVRLQGALTPSDRLLRLTKLALVTEEGTKQNSLTKERVAPGGGIDLEFESDVVTISPEAALYETCYVTSHKAQCRASAFTCDGQLIATGSVDASIKVLDVDRMLAKSAQAPEQAAQETPQQNMENHPVIRTLYDHIEEVTCLDYHPQYPNVQLLASGSKDYTVKFFDFTKPSVKRATKSIQEADVVRCLSFHPSGDFILVGTQHPTLRLYDSNTLQCFVSCNPADQHKAAISAVKYSPNANLYVSCSKDGDIKVWDGVSNRCIATYTRAHDGEEVSSVVFSRNSKYILSSGKDSLVKLWELSTGRALITYTGAGSSKQDHRTQAVFNHTEDFVFFPDEKTTSLCCWDSRNAERQRLLSLGHNNVVRSIVHSPTGPAFVTCSDDYRARFWYRRANME